MKRSTWQTLVLVAASVPLFAGCIVYRDEPAGEVTGEVTAVTPPEPPVAQVEVVPIAPGPPNVWVWVPGSWEWRGHHWIWVRGRWAPRPHPGAVWVSGGWVHRGHRYVWVHGYWR
ncbi:MAG TPA: hypothetical protein VFV81_04175 [Verrucomicrobiae bacterium]|nr:hypothetical protein [Verrucomicrobiae bacterium]